MKIIWYSLASFGFSLCFVGVSWAEAKAFGEGDLLFVLKVKPLIREKCFACHGENEERKGGLDLRTRAGFLAGGNEFSNVLIPQNPEESTLIKAVKWAGDLEMPPKENDRLTPNQIRVLERWIGLGAPWPSLEMQERIRLAEREKHKTEAGILIKTSGGLSSEWTDRRYREEDLWAFLPLKKVAIPAISKTKFANPIDAFIGKKLAESGFDFAPSAKPKTLIRRAFYDLLGLPPSPNDVKSFLENWNRNPEMAWEMLIDRLLASPHYGERWAQHWLDVARYADTGGYSNDYERSNAWRYRDYVVRSFNEDKSFDDFIVEQLAGDELWEMQKDSQKDPALLIATGFLRMGPFDPAMVKLPAARQIFLDDIVNAVGETFLSTTMRCFKCHDHKFDPLPTRDYYRFYAAFSGTQIAERPAPFLKIENQNGFEEGKRLVSKLRDFAISRKNLLTEKREKAARKWYAARGLEYVSFENRKSIPDEKKPPRHAGLDYVDQGRLKVREQDERIWTRRLERFEPMVQSIYNGADPRFLNARKLRMPKKIRRDWRPQNRILMGGTLEAPGESVAPGVLSATALPVSLNSENPFVISNALSGRRLALARWIANPKNPLTVRSIVNRIWGYHFGKALAGNPNNFGAKGAKPTHPKLLDWLARDFISGDWHFKRFHRLLMTSKTYRQSSNHPQMNRLKIADPNNSLLAYFSNRRLTAEEIRDTMLAISGELNTELGGLAIRPEINMEVALQPRMIQFSIAPAYQPSQAPSKRNRRSLYAYKVRGQADPFLEIFNQPNPNESCEARHSASVSPQAFTLFNSDLMSDRAIAFARRLMRESDILDGQIRRGFELAFSRLPSAKELQRMSDYVKSMREYHHKVQPQSVQYPDRITRSLVEELSGRPFEYEEILPVFENYIADEKPADVSPNIRALADFCLILLNSNEFIYVY